VESFIEKIQSISHDVLFKYLGAIWNFKVTTIDNNDVTIANIIIAIIIFSIGFRISKRFSKYIVAVLPSAKELNENTKSTVESITFYMLLILFIFTSLSIAQIPLKIFALLGGALAIGFGFGSQNIIKNFISGIILMVEQPIRVGDIIQVEGSEGRIIRIGARSTHIRTYDNIDILVPNSILLENNVINWTLSDNDIRTNVFVGVAYGSNTKKVEKLLVETVTKVPKVLDNRPVVCYFHEFGDNSLNFEVQFWCHMPRPSARKLVESEVRHAINEVFEKEGITISFPQRDLHIDTIKPLEVKIS